MFSLVRLWMGTSTSPLVVHQTVGAPATDRNYFRSNGAERKLRLTSDAPSFREQRTASVTPLRGGGRIRTCDIRSMRVG